MSCPCTERSTTAFPLPSTVTSRSTPPMLRCTTSFGAQLFRLIQSPSSPAPTVGTAGATSMYVANTRSQVSHVYRYPLAYTSTFEKMVLVVPWPVRRNVYDDPPRSDSGVDKTRFWVVGVEETQPGVERFTACV